MHTDAYSTPYLDLNTREGFVEHLRRKTEVYPELPSFRAARLSDYTKDYSHVLRDQEFEARWEFDPEYSSRCGRYKTEFFDHIRTTVRAYQRISDRGMTEFQRDWLACAWSLVMDVEGMGWTQHVACGREIERIVALSMKLPELDLASDTISTRVRHLRAFITTGCPVLLGAPR